MVASAIPAIHSPATGVEVASRYVNGPGTKVRMRLSQYPYVIVRIACRRCPRRGIYRLARLAVRFGSEAELTHIRDVLTADCAVMRAQLETEQGGRIEVYNRCQMHWPDLSSGRESDTPGADK